MDTLTKAQRSERMSLIRSKDTKPELAVRRLVHGMGYRYRLHAKTLPGKPDMVFGSRAKVIFVQGLLCLPPRRTSIVKGAQSACGENSGRNTGGRPPKAPAKRCRPV